tara:strand:+ start:1594 stop:1926 length:333 start_codon:yes stop_codon:yes gene_type:complete
MARRLANLSDDEPINMYKYAEMRSLREIFETDVRVAENDLEAGNVLVVERTSIGERERTAVAYTDMGNVERWYYDELFEIEREWGKREHSWTMHHQHHRQVWMTLVICAR